MSAETIEVNAAQWKRMIERQAKADLSARKATVKNVIFVEKAKAAGFTVTKAEIDAKIAADDAKKALESVTAQEQE
ncbi:MAG: hypothetical protein ACD_20C00433G0002 [uncultured bacterium]|nr:MAG: hypothetical protein ACD_20C00433G0002 [uncultured bacterium]